VFEVFLSDAAKRDLRLNVQWWSEHRSVEEAECWYVSLLQSIYSLEHFPERCGLAREADSLGIEIRNLWFGLSTKQTHRAVFVIERNKVSILRVLSARQDIAETDITGEA
jgi:plasmid stabilization system protein ParE